MPQLLLDPTDASSAKQLKSAPEPLPEHVREFGFIPDFKLWEPGDLLLFSAVEMNPAQRAIVNAQVDLGYAEEHARWHHAAVYIGERALCEATFRGVGYHGITDTFLTSRIRIRRIPQLKRKERFRIAIRALMRLTKPYDFWSVTLYWLRSQNTSFGAAFSREFRVKGRAFICSELYHEAYMAVTSRVLLTDPDRDVLPADLSASRGLVDIPAGWAQLP